MKINKSIIIPIVFLLIGVGVMLAYNQGTKWVNVQKVNFYNGGVVDNTNQLYSQAITGQLMIRNFILDEEG